MSLLTRLRTMRALRPAREHELPDVLTELVKTLRASQIEFHFAEMKDPVKDKMRRLEVFDLLGADAFHPTMGAAVDDYLEDHQVDWKP